MFLHYGSKKDDPKLSKKDIILYCICLWIPGLLIFPVLFAALTQLIFALPGTDFTIIGLATTVAILVLTLLMAYLIKWLLPETDIRLELLFMINLLIAALGIVATVNGRTAAVGTNDVDWYALLTVLGLLAFGCVGGLIINRFIIIRKINRIQKL